MPHEAAAAGEGYDVIAAPAGDSGTLPPFGWSTVATQWQFAPLVTALAAAGAAAYLWGVWRVARRHPARPWPLWRTALFLGGLAAVVIATESGIGAYDDVLFWDHMIQHLLLIMVAPPLLVEPSTTPVKVSTGMTITSMSIRSG